MKYNADFNNKNSEEIKGHKCHSIPEAMGNLLVIPVHVTNIHGTKASINPV